MIMIRLGPYLNASYYALCFYFTLFTCFYVYTTILSTMQHVRGL